MTLVISDLANDILQALGPPKDKNSNPISVTPQMTGYATTVINTFKAAKVANAIGTVNAVGAPGGSISGGVATGGTVSNVSESTWLSGLESAFPSSPASSLQEEATASSGYLQSNAKVAFASGSITGSCTATPTSPGELADGAGTGGTVSSLSGSSWASAVEAALGSAALPLASPVYTACANYLMANATCAYASGSVEGEFSAGGGTMEAGMASNGTIA